MFFKVVCMMNINKLKQIIDSIESEYIEFLTDICNIESPTEYKEGVDAVGKYIIEKPKKETGKLMFRNRKYRAMQFVLQ